MVCAQEDCHGNDQNTTMKRLTMKLVERPLLNVIGGLLIDAE